MRYMIYRYFLIFWRLAFHSVVYFEVQKFLSLRLHLPGFYCVASAFHIPRDFGMLSSEPFLYVVKVLGLMCKSVIHFESFRA